MAYGLQSDAAYRLSEAHTMRAGLYVQTDHLTSNTTGNVLATADQFLQDVIVPTGDVPFGVIDDTQNTQWIQSVYLQDEWHIDSKVTVNYGLRFDHYTAFSSGSQLSPRVNMVWQAREDTTVHARLLTLLLAATVRAGHEYHDQQVRVHERRAPRTRR